MFNSKTRKKGTGDFDRSGADSVNRNEGMFVLLRANRWKRVVFKREKLYERCYPEMGDGARMLVFDKVNCTPKRGEP